MARYFGGEFVKDGYYWSGFKGELIAIDGKGGKLPGEKKVCYRRIPLIALIPFGLFIGGAYVLFLPFAGFAMVIGFIGYKVWQGLVYSFLRLTAPGWAPGEAFFTRRRKSRQKPAEIETEEKPSQAVESEGRLAVLEQEIAEKRKNEEDNC